MSSRSFAPARTLAGPRRWTPGDRLAGPRLDDGADTGPDTGTNADAGIGPESDGPLVGVLALQGDVLEHRRALRRVGARTIEVRRRDQLDDLDALVLPGGESTTIGKLLDVFGLLEPLRERITGGLPVLGTCAGMILLAAELEQDEPQPLVGGLDVRVRRNAFGRQVDSFDVALAVEAFGSPPLDVSFIRAPVVTAVLTDDVEVLASVDLGPVLVRQRDVWAAAFHPEVTGDDRLHAAFVASLPGR